MRGTPSSIRNDLRIKYNTSGNAAAVAEAAVAEAAAVTQ